MNSIGPIALAQSTDLVRRAVRGSGPEGDAVPAVPERPRSRWTVLRLRRRRAAAGRTADAPAIAAPAAAHSGSDQCSIVAAPRKPARA